MVATASLLLGRALPAARELTALRARASALLGCVAAVRGGMEGETPTTLRLLAARLGADVRGRATDPAWPWPEPILTYENGLPVQALIVAGVHLGDAEMVDAGVRTLDWLVDDARPRRPATCRRSATAGGPATASARSTTSSRSRQPPSLLAAHAALAATGAARQLATHGAGLRLVPRRQRPQIAVASPADGACFDALTPAGVNANQGAESTLVWLIALEHVRLRARARAAPTQVPRSRRARSAPVA